MQKTSKLLKFQKIQDSEISEKSNRNHAKNEETCGKRQKSDKNHEKMDSKKAKTIHKNEDSSPFSKTPSLADFGLSEYERRESLSKSRLDGSAESNASSARLQRRLSRDFRKVPLFDRDDPDFASFCFRREQAMAQEGGERAEISILEKELSERYGDDGNSSL